MLNTDLVFDFIDKFYGYGDLNAPLWFIGMEEAGVSNEEGAQKRLSAWDTRGRQVVEDVHDYHVALNIHNLTNGDKAKLQSTWAKLIYCQIAVEGGNPTKNDVRLFQGHVWGRQSSQTCLLELMPMPKQKASDWKYNEWTERPEFWSRDLYMAHFAAKRAAGLQCLIRKHQPKAVIFYGKSNDYAAHWPWIAGLNPKHWRKEGKWSKGAENGVAYFVAPHPVAHGTTAEEWAKIGRGLSHLVQIDR